MSSQDTIELPERDTRADTIEPDLEAAEIPQNIGLRHRTAICSETTRSQGSINHTPEQGDRRYAELLTLNSYKTSIWAVLTWSWTNIGLLFVPVAFAFQLVFPDRTVSLVIVNFIAVGALSSLLLFASNQIVLHVGGFAEEIIREFQKNLIEIIFAIIALKDCELQTLQAVLMGSMVNNLLVVGICFQLGGLRYFEQRFDKGKAQINCSLLMLGATIQILPGVMSFTTSDSSDLDPYSNTPFNIKSIACMIRAIAIAMLVFYCCYLLFWFFSYKIATNEEFKRHHSRVSTSIGYPSGLSPKGLISSMFSRKDSSIGVLVEATQPINGTATTQRAKPEANLVVAIIVLIASTVFIVFTTQYLWKALDVLMWNSTESRYRISPKFVGVILIQLITNMAQAVVFIEAINDSLQDRLDNIIDTMIGGSIQMALCVTPLLVVIGWIMGIPLLLVNDPLDCVILFLSVLVLNYVVNDGKSNWFEGIILLTLYIIFAISFWYYPGRNLSKALEGMDPLPEICRVDGNQ